MLSFTPNSLYLLLPKGMGNGGCGHFITHCLCHWFLLRRRTPHTLALLQHGLPPMGDSSTWASPMWVLPTGCSFSQTASAWFPSTGCSPSGTECSSVSPPQGHKTCQKTYSSTSFSLPGSTGPARSLLWCRLPTGSQPLLGIHLILTSCWRGVLHGLQVDICSAMNVHGMQGDSLPRHGLLHGLQENLCSGAWSPSSSYFTELDVCRVVSLTCSHSSLQLKWLVWFFLLFSNMLSHECYHWRAWPWPALNPSCNCLALALSDMEEASSSFSQKPPL